MWYVLLSGMLAVSAADVEVQTLTGPEVSGQLVSLDETGLVVETQDGQKTFPLADLLAVRPTQAAPAGAPSRDAFLVRLVDGSLLVAPGYSVSDRKATITLAGGPELQIPTRSISWVRLRAPSEGVDEQWRTITGQRAAGDVVVIRKSDTALDQLEGVLHDIADNKVTFEFDGDKIPVDIQKLEGIVYFHPLSGREGKPACKVSTRDGSAWNARSLALDGEMLRMTTTAGAEVSLPLDRVDVFDFSSGNVVYLSDLEPVSSDWTPFLESPLLDSQLQLLYGPKRDRAFDGGPLRLGDRSFRKGLALHSRTELVYRLTDEYRRLQAEVGIDDTLRQVGHVELVIFGDDRELLREAVSGRDEPRTLDLDIRGVRRLKILVDYGEKLDIADHLHLCNARIIK